MESQFSDVHSYKSIIIILLRAQLLPSYADDHSDGGTLFFVCLAQQPPEWLCDLDWYMNNADMPTLPFQSSTQQQPQSELSDKLLFHNSDYSTYLLGLKISQKMLIS